MCRSELVSNDTSAAHVAAGLGRPSVAVPPRECVAAGLALAGWSTNPGDTP
jgi:hypothetical protein